MDWQIIVAIIGTVITATASVLGANAWLMSVVIEKAISKALLGVAKEYVTKQDFESHIEHCPNFRRGK